MGWRLHRSIEYIGPDDYSQERLCSLTVRLFNEEPSGMFRKCDLCHFDVRSEVPEVLVWAMHDHMYRYHPTKSRKDVE